jgi:hypothetical protein
MSPEVEQEPADPVTIKIYGMDADGKAFFEHVRARSLTLQNALLEDVEHRLKSGEILGVQHKGRRARGQVSWICELGRLDRHRVGIHLLIGERCPWEEALSASQTAGSPRREQRRHPRYKIVLALDLRESGSAVKARLQCTDISLSGCYVQTMFPLPIGTLLVTGLWLGAERVEVTAIVRTCDGNVGMGIEFLNLTSEQEVRLQEFLRFFSIG